MTELALQQTLALVKPDAIEHADEIVELAKQHGFTVLTVSLNPETKDQNKVEKLCV